MRRPVGLQLNLGYTELMVFSSHSSRIMPGRRAGTIVVWCGSGEWNEELTEMAYGQMGDMDESLGRLPIEVVALIEHSDRLSWLTYFAGMRNQHC